MTSTFLGNYIGTYGYAALLVGTFFEGETILILGALAAQQGYLALPWVILCAFTGSLCGDNVFFYLGRRHGRRFLPRFGSWQAPVKKAERLLERFGTPLILAFHFLYGMRIGLLLVFGRSRIGTWKFISLNSLGALLWAVSVGVAGFLFGHVLEGILGRARNVQILVLAGFAVIGVLFWALRRLRAGRKKQTP